MRDQLENHPWLERIIPADLSNRQRDVLFGLIRGFSEKQIARALALSVHTVHIYIKAVYQRYSVHTRTELLGYCIVRLLEIHDPTDDVIAGQLAGKVQQRRQQTNGHCDQRLTLARQALNSKRLLPSESLKMNPIPNGLRGQVHCATASVSTSS
jgi:DNA-binding CsgD family transcriptional regulator